VFDSCAPPIIALDKADPNYDASEQSGLAFAVRELEPSPELDSLAAFRAAAQQLLRELFASGDVEAAAAELRSLEAPWLGAAFVRWAVSLSLDRGDAEKELAARLLCAVSPDPAVLPRTSCRRALRACWRGRKSSPSMSQTRRSSSAFGSRAP